MKNSDGITDRVRIIIMWAHLYEDKRVCVDGFEELTKYVVNECYKIFVRLFLGKGFLVGEDGLEQVQGGYLTRPLRNTCKWTPHARKAWKMAVDPLGRTVLRPWHARPVDAAG
jgi:hypothetical protein